MTPAQQAERDWAAYYLLQRSAPLSAAGVTPDHFGDPRVAGWYRTARKLSDWVRFDELGITTDQCVDLTGRLVQTRDIQEVERRIVEGWALRRTRAACATFLDSTRGEGATTFDDASQALLEAVTEAQAGMPCDSVTYAEAGRTAISEWIEAARATAPRAIPLPWPKLHRHTHGLPRKKIVAIVGRSSEHKTSAARAFAAHGADKSFRVLYWTMEDANEDIAGRTIADRVGYVNTTALATGGWPHGRKPTDLDLKPFLADAATHLNGTIGTHLRLMDEAAPRRHRVITALLAEAARGLDMVVLDFVQLIRPDDDRTRITPEWWRETLSLLNDVAKRCDLAIVVVSQLEKVGSAASEQESRLPRAIEMPFGAQMWQGTYGILAIGFEGNRLRCKIEKWKSAEAKHGQEGQVAINLNVDPAHDRITEV